MCRNSPMLATHPLDMLLVAIYPQNMSHKDDFDDTQRPGWSASQPYQDLPRLPPSEDLETARVLRACITARAALAQLNQAIELIPNPRVLLTCLPLLEAQASSEIENIVTTTEELFRHLEVEGSGSPATREALRYREALMEGYRALDRRPLGIGVAQQVCTRIKAIDMSPRKVPGTAIGNQSTGEIIYTPPSGHDLILDLLSNWGSSVGGFAGGEMMGYVAMRAWACRTMGNAFSTSSVLHTGMLTPPSY